MATMNKQEFSDFEEFVKNPIIHNPDTSGIFMFFEQVNGFLVKFVMLYLKI